MPSKSTDQYLLSKLDEVLAWATANEQELKARGATDFCSRLRQSHSKQERKHYMFFYYHSDRTKATPILAARLRGVDAVVQSDMAENVVACVVAGAAQSSASPSRAAAQDATPAKRHKAASTTGGEIASGSPVCGHFKMSVSRPVCEHFKMAIATPHKRA